ncbi:hypothetical protein HA402_011689 [Bradysia odoriphaga]|nr:hypothetical protein HA402_011689 [Bradysia odoriphaga]
MNRKRLMDSLPKQTAASANKKPKLCLYLEDNTPIRTVEVNNVPNLSEDRCFECYGPVERVKILRKTGNKLLAFVTFIVPDDAAELIQNGDDGFMRFSNLGIKIADDEHQIKIDPNVMNLEKVNDHCLLSIMSHLNLMDVMNLCKTSKRMQSVGQLFYKKFAKLSFEPVLGITLDSSINVRNLPVILVLEAIGNQIKSIDCNYITTAQFELLVNHCPNVSELRLYLADKLTSATVRRNKSFFAGLKKLYIKSSSIYDTSLKYILSGNNLRVLDLYGCDNIHGNFFNRVNRSKLKILKIADCWSMDKKYVPLSEWENKFTTLAIDMCGSYLTCLTIPPEKLENIEVLELDFSNFEGTTDGLNFSGLTMLKKLTLIRKYKWDFVDANSMINGLAQINSLKSLSIQGITVDSNTVVDGLRSIKNLRDLRMYRIENKLGQNLYELFRDYLSTLQELSLYFRTERKIDGKPSYDMIAGMPMLHYFSHSSITWEWLDLICQAKSVTAFDYKTPPLKIGVSGMIFFDSKKKTFEAATKGAITLCIHEL